LKADEISTHTNTEKESWGEKLSNKETLFEKDLKHSKDIEVIYQNKTDNMEFKKKNHGLENTRNKLRLSKTKPSIEKTEMEAASMEIVPQIQLEMENARKSFENQTQTPKSSNWNFNHLNFDPNESPNAPNSK
jgi:hypothetical protein